MTKNVPKKTRFCYINLNGVNFYSIAFLPFIDIAITPKSSFVLMFVMSTAWQDLKL